MEDITRELEIPLDLDEAWRRLFDPDTLSSWMGGDFAFEPRVGGDVEFADPRGATRWGRIHLWDPPNRVRWTWRDLDGERGPTTVTIELEEGDEATVVRFIETRPEPFEFDLLPPLTASIPGSARITGFAA